VTRIDKHAALALAVIIAAMLLPGVIEWLL
jgi:hypothetical protein